jgi:hypothetical protein
MLLVEGRNSNKAALLYKLWVTAKVGACAGAVGTSFLDLRGRRGESEGAGDAEEGLLQTSKYLDYHPYLVLFGSALDILVSTFVFPDRIMSNSIGFVFSAFHPNHNPNHASFKC